MLARSARLALFGAVVASMTAAATPLRPAFELEGVGLEVAAAGVGLRGAGAGQRAIRLAIGGPVEKAVLYWAGRQRPCEPDPEGALPCAPPVEPYRDQALLFDGVPVTGEVIGTEVGDGELGELSIGYAADVTAIVAARGPGAQAFLVADADLGSNLTALDGAGLLVAWTDAADPVRRRLAVHHGLDAAHGEAFGRGEHQVTDPFTFNHGAAKHPRAATLVLLVADCVAARPDRVDVTGNPSLVSRLDGSDGPEWDTEVVPVTIRRQVGATTVQVFSEPINENPDSLLWVAAALLVPLDAPAGCAPSFWSARASWEPTGIVPTQRLGDVFSQSSTFPTLFSATLGQALRFKDGPGALGGAKALLQAGAAALLNAAHPQVSYPLWRAQVIAIVDTALASRDEAAMREAAAALTAANAAGCPV